MMMQITCDHCGKRYRLDKSRITGPKARFRCKQCGGVIVVLNPDAASQPPGSTAELQQDAYKASDEWQGQGDRRLQVVRPPAPPAMAKPRGDQPATRRKPFRFGLTGKVVAIMLAVSLLPFLIYWATLFKQTESQLRQEKERLLTQIAHGMASHVDEWIDKNVRVLEAAANLPDIISMDRRRQEPILKAIHEAYPWMYLVFTVGPDGMNVARNDGKPLKDYSDRQYYKDVMAGKDFTWQTLIGKTSKKPALVLAVPIKSAGKVVGVMANAMTVDAISKMVATWREGRSGRAFLVDEQGKVMAHYIHKYYLEQKNLSAHPLIAAFKAGSRGLVHFDDPGGRPLVGVVKETRHGWALAVQQEEAEAFAILQKMKLLAIVVLAATLLVVTIVALLAGRALVKPVKTLTQAAEYISLGDLNVEIDVKSKDEIGQLAQAISRMQDSLRLSLERLRRRKAAV